MGERTKNRISSILSAIWGALFLLSFAASKAVYLSWVENLPTADERGEAVVLMTAVSLIIGVVSFGAFQFVDIWSDEQ